MLLFNYYNKRCFWGGGSANINFSLSYLTVKITVLLHNPYSTSLGAGKEGVSLLSVPNSSQR